VSAIDAALIFSETPGGLPATYTVPPGAELVLQSVFADFNGAGASGTFLACLSILSQDNVVMARVFPDTQLAVGDTAEVSYAPFLRAAAAAAAGADLQWAISYGSVTAPNAANSSDTSVQTLITTSDSSYFELSDDELTVLKTGLYLVFSSNAASTSSVAGTIVYQADHDYNTASLDHSVFHIRGTDSAEGSRNNAADTSRSWELNWTALHNIKAGALNGGFYTTVRTRQVPGATLAFSSNIAVIRIADALPGGLP
jgi:hypothetical protein